MELILKILKKKNNLALKDTKERYTLFPQWNGSKSKVKENKQNCSLELLGAKDYLCCVSNKGIFVC